MKRGKQKVKKEFIKNIIKVGMATLIITNMYYIPASAKWINDPKNNWNWIENKVKATGWKKIDEKWYYFNNDGIMSTGWLNYNGKWYNLSNSGAMNTGWKEIGGKWYHLNTDGAMSIGWIDDNGTRYFTNSSGEMETGTLRIDGEIYTFSDSGAMINNDEGDRKTRIAYVSTNSDSLNIRLKATTSSDIIGTVAKGAEIEIIGNEENGFYPIIINKKKGWVSSKWISFEKTASANGEGDSKTRIAYVSTNSDSLNIRLESTISSDIIGTVAKGAEIEIIGNEENGFYPIIINKKKGWVSSKWISFGKPASASDSGVMINNDEENGKGDSKTRIAYVSTNSGSLNIRLEATISSNIIGTVAKGTEIEIIGNEENGFYPIIINKKKGWVSSKWISFEKPENTYSNTSPNSNSNINTSPTDAEDKGVIRYTEPSLDNKHYYSDMNIFYKARLSPPFYNGGKLIKGNCTWYAWGRAWEVTGNQPNDARFIGNAYEWWEANKKSGKYQYGSEPKVGSIAVWKSDLPGSGGNGHVAVVEKIKDGKIYISESSWHGGSFRYREIYEKSYLYGYVYLDKPNF